MVHIKTKLYVSVIEKKYPDQLLFVATEVGDLIAQHTQKEQSMGNRRSEISSVHKPNPLETNNVSIDSAYTNKQEKSIKNNKKSKIQGDINMTKKKDYLLTIMVIDIMTKIY